MGEQIITDFMLQAELQNHTIQKCQFMHEIIIIIISIVHGHKLTKGLRTGEITS